MVEFFAAPIGGGFMAFVLWFAMKTSCPSTIAGFPPTECVHLAGGTFTRPAQLLGVGGLAGFGVAVVLKVVQALFKP
jgi:hypothetical protein